MVQTESPGTTRHSFRFARGSEINKIILKIFKIRWHILFFIAMFGLHVANAQKVVPQSSFQEINVSTPFDSVSFFQSFRSAFMMTNGIKMHYVIGGTGKQVVVLLHGFPADWYSWRKIMPALANEYTVIVPDMRGLGLSDKPKTGYSKKNMAKDIYGLVHQLGYKNIYLAGYDFGGPVSYAYTCEYPNDVKKLVMFECGGVAGGGLDKLMDITHGGIWHFGFFMQPMFPEMLIKGREREFFTAFAYGDIVVEKNAFSQTDIDHYILNLAAPDGLDGAFEYYRAYSQDVKDNLLFSKRKITIPVLAMDGLLGGLTKKSMQKLAYHVSGTVIKKGGHWLAEERPNDILEQMLPFFRGTNIGQLEPKKPVARPGFANPKANSMFCSAAL
jgi:pimeloyl-ACP methyl ester carboxylesterase